MAKRDEQAKLIADQQATIAELRALVSEMRAVLEQLRATSAARDAELEALKRKVFGKKSEKMPSPKDALRKKDQTKADPAATQFKRKDNEARKAELETEVVAHSVPDEKRVCPACASAELEEDMPKARVDFDYVPGYFRRRVHQQERLVCTCCQTEVTAAAPKRPFDNSPYGLSLVAQVDGSLITISDGRSSEATVPSAGHAHETGVADQNGRSSPSMYGRWSARATARRYVTS